MPDQETIDQRAQERQERRAKNAKARSAYRAKQKEKRSASRGDAPPLPPPAAKEHGPGRPKVRQGKVVSAKADKTIVVRVDSARRHRMYKKIIRESTTLHAHDERNDAGEGDLVRVIECRPMSRTKRWRLTDVLERSR
jgi:small subunit ribosomal protein S17